VQSTAADDLLAQTVGQIPDQFAIGHPIPPMGPDIGHWPCSRPGTRWPIAHAIAVYGFEAVEDRWNDYGCAAWRG
jgi:hypothetical protein